MALNFQNIKLSIAALAIVFGYLLIEQATAFGQQLSEKYDHPYLKSGDSLVAVNEPFKALEAYQSALEKYVLEADPSGLIAAACKMAGLYIDFKQFDKAENTLTQALQAFKHTSPDSTFLADIYYRLGNLHHRKIQPDSALSYHLHALDIRKRNISEYSDPVASSYIAIADIYRYTFLDYFTAEKYYLKAFEIRGKAGSEGQYKKLAALCYNLATTYRLKGDMEKAITYAYQAQNFYKMNDSGDYLYFSLCQNVLANTFLQQSQYQQSMGHFFNAIRYIQNVPRYSVANSPNTAFAFVSSP